MEETLKQVRSVRENLGRFDRSEMGWLAITGRDRYTWLQGMVSNDVRRLESRETTRLQACILDPTGHVIADITLIDVPQGSSMARTIVGEAFILLETSPGEAEWIGAHLDRLLIMEDANIVDITARLLCTSIQGPARNTIQSTLDQCAEAALMVEADHTGSGGIDIYECGESDGSPCRTSLERLALVEVGPAAREILRIEAGIPKYGADMDSTTLAPEAGIIGTHISLSKGCYVGQEIVARIDSRGHTNRALTGLLVMGETLPVAGEKLFADDIAGDGKEVGRITSVAPLAPAVGGRPVALGYVRHEHRSAGTWLRLGSADSCRIVEVADLPFYRGRTAAL